MHKLASGPRNARGLDSRRPVEFAWTMPEFGQSERWSSPYLEAYPDRAPTKGVLSRGTTRGMPQMLAQVAPEDRRTLSTFSWSGKARVTLYTPRFNAFTTPKTPEVWRTIASANQGRTSHFGSLARSTTALSLGENECSTLSMASLSNPSSTRNFGCSYGVTSPLWPHYTETVSEHRKPSSPVRREALQASLGVTKQAANSSVRVFF